MKLLVLAESYKKGGLCIAGIDYETKEYVRIGHKCGNDCGPIRNEEILLSAEEYVGLLDVVDVTVEKLPSSGCHTEDYDLISFNKIIKSIDLKELDEIYSKIKHKKYIFKDNSYKLNSSVGNEYDKSLILCKVTEFSINYFPSGANGIYKPIASFMYNGNSYCGLSVTDMIACGYPFNIGKKKVENANAYIMVSLPNDDWAKVNGYFKYVSGIILIDKEYDDYEPKS